MDTGRHIGEFHKVLEVMERAVAASLIQVVNEGGAIHRQEHSIVATNLNVTGRVTGVLGVFGGRGGHEGAGQPLRKAYPFAVHVSAGVAPDI